MKLEGKAVIVEDKANVSGYLESLLTDWGFSPIIIVTNLIDALDAAQKTHTDAVLFTVDGNYSPRRTDCAEGQQVIATVKHHIPLAKVVGISSEVLTNVDAYVCKNGLDNKELKMILEAI